MSRKLSLGAAVSIAAVTAAVTVSLTYGYAMKSFNAKVADVNERQAMYTKLSEIDQKARQDYVGKIDEATLTEGICAGYVAGLGNSHAKYMSAEKYKDYLGGTGSKNVGVGIRTVQDDDGNMEVIEVMPGSPAEKAGIRKGDTIVGMDGKEIARITYGDALNRLDGTAGTKVTFSLLRGGAGSASSAPGNLLVTVTRAEYVEQTITSSMENGNVACFRITEFTNDTPDEFAKALTPLLKKNAVGIVVDLRNSPGGSVESMASVLDVLLPAGNTVTVRDKSGKTTVEHTSKPDEVNLPVSVIVDKNTFGAAEIFASDIAEFKKGLLVGEKTAGYGTKDEAVPLSDGSAMLIPVADYLTLSGKTFDGKGIGVDISKSLDDSQRELLARNSLFYEDDPQFQAAVTALVRQGAAVQQLPGTAQQQGEAAASGAATD